MYVCISLYRKRLRQHNGEIKNGARKTSRRRPWSHIAIVSGFPNKIVALQFEWQWQNPKLSRIIKHCLDFNAHGRGWKSNVRILHSMLQCALWKQLHLTVHFLNSEAYILFQSWATTCPNQFKMNTIENFDVLIVKTLPKVIEGENLACFICKGKSGRVWKCVNDLCIGVTHLSCACTLACVDVPTMLIPSSITCSKCYIVSDYIQIYHISFQIKQGIPNVMDLTEEGEGEDDEDAESGDDSDSMCSDVSGGEVEYCGMSQSNK